jgi:hypothetical protein
MFPILSNIALIRGFKAAGVSIWIKPDDTLEINVIVIRRLRNKLSVVQKASFISIKEFSESISGIQPIYISVDGKGILHKIIDTNNNRNIEKVLPGANNKDFVIQDLVIDETRAIVSILRKDKLEELVNLFNESKYDILKIFLGPFSISNIVKLVHDNSKIILPYYDLVLNKNSIAGFEKNLNSSPDFNVEIESELLNSKFIVPFSNGLTHFIENKMLSIDYLEINKQVDNFRFKRLFNMCGWSLLILFFASLLINFIVFDIYHEKNQILVSQVGNNRETLSKIEKIQNLIKTKWKKRSK